MQKITIKNFINIHDVEMEIKKLTVIIGPQAQGKSIISKLIFYFSDIPKAIYRSMREGETFDQFHEALKEKFKVIFHEDSYRDKNFAVSYVENGFAFEIKGIKKKGAYKLNFNYPYKKVRLAFGEASALLNRPDEQSQEMGIAKTIGPNEFNLLFTKSIIDQLRCTYKACTYIPAGRSFFSNLDGNVFSFLSSGSHLDFFIREFGGEYRSLRQRFQNDSVRQKGRTITDKSVDEIIEKIICGKYIIEKGKDKIVDVNGRKLPLVNTSSGQQEALPMVHVIRSMLEMKTMTNRFLVIEEPEAHLFPEAQWNVVKLISKLFNNEQRNSALITTHSPYILTAINILIEKGRHRNIIDLDLQDVNSVDSSEVAAYYLESGVSKDIIDEKCGLIEGHAIDDISDKLSTIFQSLLDSENSEIVVVKS